MIRSRSLPALFAALALALAACGTTPSPSETVGDAPSDAPSEPAAAASESAAASEAAGEETSVRLTGFAFEPTEVTVAAGTEVSFVNADSAAHTVTEGTDGAASDDPIIDEELQQNGSTSFTFDEPGTYQITCLLHPSMNMTIVVE